MKPNIKLSEQNVLNESFDDTYKQLAILLLGENGSNLYRLQVDANGLLKLSPESYEYMGKQESGNYVYFGFKQNGGANYKIMRKDTTDDSAWAYCYGTSGWTTAWSDPTVLSYSDPPSS